MQIEILGTESLVDANPFQMPAEKVATGCRVRTKKLRFWTKGPRGLSQNMVHRLQSLRHALDSDLSNAEGQNDGPLTFSLPVPHGQKSEHRGTVMMTRIKEGDEVFVHATDIQLLDDEAVSRILSWQPTVVLASGPPAYFTATTQNGVAQCFATCSRS
jgi:hypothetical protein